MERFGKPKKYGSNTMTLEEIALEMGITHQSVACYQRRAIEKIQKICIKHNITYEEFLQCLKYTQLF
jgi:DNA-directed RNA polymerase sigma subunit (sigma70/sigma32)